MSINIVKLSIIGVELIYTLIRYAAEWLFPHNLTIEMCGQLSDFFLNLKN